MTKVNEKLTIISLAILCCTLSLTGCKDTGKEEALAETAKAKAELTRVKGILEKTQNERDDLKAKVAKISESLKAAQTKIGGFIQSGNQEAMNIKEQLAKLSEERDTAIAKATDAQTMVGKWKGQLQEQIEKTVELEGQNKKLQEIIDELKKKLGSEVKIPSIPKL